MRPIIFAFSIHTNSQYAKQRVLDQLETSVGIHPYVSIYRRLNSQHRQRQPRDEREVQIIAILLRFMYPYDYLHCIVHCFPFLVGLRMGLKNGSAWEKFAPHSRSVEHSLDGREGERQFRRDP